MVESNPREYCLNDILAVKHYPQVLRVTRPYYVHEREYLKVGQYITVLDRRRVELLTGVDREVRPFKVRKDRSANVEVVEDDRIVYSLSEVAEVASHITAIEIRKELRFEKSTFTVGEIFTIEKIGKSFRGRIKNITLKREKDAKIYRLPLDIMGAFKLVAGKTKLPITKLLTLRTLPLRAQFRNTPTSSNFPSGVVSVRDSVICDIVYILTVQTETYTYEAFSIDANIYVEKCNLVIPRPILKVNPLGMYVNSSEFIPPIKTMYKQRMAELDSKLIENIYAPGYYGSATYEKKQCNIDEHLIVRTRSSTSLSLDETYINAMRTLSEVSSTPSTPDSDLSGPPVLPRHSKNKKLRENTVSFPAIHEFDWSQKPNIEKASSESNVRTNHPSAAVPPATTNRMSCDTSMDDTVGRRNVIEFESESVTIELPNNNSEVVSRNSMQSVNGEINERKVENLPIRVYCLPVNENESVGGGRDRLVSRVYESSHGPALKVHSRSSSITTEDSGDSGVVLTFGNNGGFSAYQHRGPPSPMEENLYAFPGRNIHTNNNSNVRRIIMPALTAPANPVGLPFYRPHSSPPLSQQNLHKVLKVDIDIGSDNNNNNNNNNNNIDNKAIGNSSETSSIYKTSSQGNGDYDDVSYNSLDDFDFRSHSIREEEVEETYVNASQFENNESFDQRINEIRNFSQEEIGVLLRFLNLSRYVPIFNKELINGHLLTELDEVTLRRDLGMTRFDARKLHKYVHGWRPVVSYADGADYSNSNPECWSVNNVVQELQNIKLQILARFCKDNHVDGSLLVDIVQNNIAETLRTEHDVSLSGIELSRLKAFTLKRWRPDNSLSQKNLSVKHNGVYNSHMTSQEKLNEKKKAKPLWNRIMSTYA